MVAPFVFVHDSSRCFFESRSPVFADDLFIPVLRFSDKIPRSMIEPRFLKLSTLRGFDAYSFGRR